MRVVEIFKSIDGEGIKAGLPVTFIRLAGCNLRCSYCDTKYSYDIEEADEMTVHEIAEEVAKLGCPRVTITGGEPLIHAGIITLLSILDNGGYSINIETNGSVPIVPIKTYKNWKDLIFTVDYKCPSSGMEIHMKKDNLPFLTNKDVLKFVVGRQEDMTKALKVIQEYPYLHANVFFSPVFGAIDPADIVAFILKHNLYDARVQLQLHKFIWDPNKRGV